MSIGFTYGVLVWKPGVLTTGTIISEPFSSLGLVCLKILIAASIPAYSHACEPAIIHKVGPCSNPLTIPIGSVISERGVSPIFR